VNKQLRNGHIISTESHAMTPMLFNPSCPKCLPFCIYSTNKRSVSIISVTVYATGFAIS